MNRVCSIFSQLLQLFPRSEFEELVRKQYSLDATVIDLCARVFDWAKFQSTKGAVKLHLLLDHEGYLPSYAVITEGKVHEIRMARRFKLPGGSVLVFDRGYID